MNSLAAFATKENDRKHNKRNSQQGVQADFLPRNSPIDVNNVAQRGGGHHRRKQNSYNMPKAETKWVHPRGLPPCNEAARQSFRNVYEDQGCFLIVQRDIDPGNSLFRGQGVNFRSVGPIRVINFGNRTAGLPTCWPKSDPRLERLATEFELSTLEAVTDMDVNESTLPCIWRWKATMPALAIASIISMCGTACAAPPLPYVSPGKYRQYSCNQLLEVARKFSDRATAPADRKRNDDVASSDSVVIVPLALQDGGHANGEAAGSKQEMDAIEEAAIQGQCEIEFVRAK
jgi:hypothetical protein